MFIFCFVSGAEPNFHAIEGYARETLGGTPHAKLSGGFRTRNPRGDFLIWRQIGAHACVDPRNTVVTLSFVLSRTQDKWQGRLTDSTLTAT